MTVLLGIDVGGSSIKAAAVDTDRGMPVSPVESIVTPAPATPDATRHALASLAARFPACTGPVGLAFPSVVRRGVTLTASNIDPSWVGVDAQALLERAAGRAGFVLNDGDAAGLAEMRYGAGRDARGTVLMLTFGTGIGSALFVDGVLWPNTELGHLEIDGREAEHRASGRVRTVERLDWPAWCERVNVVLARLHTLLWPDLFVLGGGVSERWEEFGSLIRSPAAVVPAKLRHAAGIVGAALYAGESAARGGR